MLFILPALLLVCLFGLFPIVYAFWISLHNWRIRQSRYIGLANYEKALGDWGGVALFVAGFLLFMAAYFVREKWQSGDFRRSWGGKLSNLLFYAVGFLLIALGWARMNVSGDPNFLDSLPITFYYAVGSVPLQLAISLVLAYILFQQIRGKEIFRIIFFLPYVTPVIATAMVFRYIFSPRDTSLANQVVSWLGFTPLQWLFEPKNLPSLFSGSIVDSFWAGPSLALVAIILFGIWTFIGYNTVIFLAGLGSIPATIYEAAEIDGANQWQLFRYVTIPLLSPVTFYLSLIGFIGTFKAFNHIYVMQVPAAQGTVETASVAIFNTFFKANNYGYASAQAILLFLIILYLTYVQNRIFSERVFYG
ncbi:MAG: sugar ABC transporter permease [Caldilineaceae bacterium]